MSRSNFSTSYKKTPEMRFIYGGKPLYAREMSVQVTREMAGIYTLGSATPVSFSRGARSVSVKLLTSLTENPINLPENKDLHILVANAHGDISQMSIYDMVRTSEPSRVHSDWVARSISWWRWNKLDEVYEQLEQMEGISDAAVFLNNLRQDGIEAGDS